MKLVVVLLILAVVGPAMKTSSAAELSIGDVLKRCKEGDCSIKNGASFCFGYGTNQAMCDADVTETTCDMGIGTITHNNDGKYTFRLAGKIDPNMNTGWVGIGFAKKDETGPLGLGISCMDDMIKLVKTTGPMLEALSFVDNPTVTGTSKEKEGWIICEFDINLMVVGQNPEDELKIYLFGNNKADVDGEMKLKPSYSKPVIGDVPLNIFSELRKSPRDGGGTPMDPGEAKDSGNWIHLDLITIALVMAMCYLL